MSIYYYEKNLHSRKYSSLQVPTDGQLYRGGTAVCTANSGAPLRPPPRVMAEMPLITRDRFLPLDFSLLQFRKHQKRIRMDLQLRSEEQGNPRHAAQGQRPIMSLADDITSRC